jgi:hypothetical protein
MIYIDATLCSVRLLHDDKKYLRQLIIVSRPKNLIEQIGHVAGTNTEAVDGGFLCSECTCTDR